MRAGSAMMCGPIEAVVYGNQEITMKENGKMTRSQEKGSTCTLMERCKKELSKKASLLKSKRPE